MEMSIERGSNRYASSVLTATSAPVSLNTKNTTWTQLIASLAFDAYWCSFNYLTESDAAMLFDFGIGAIGAEVPIIENIAQLYRSTHAVESLQVPFYIPAGSRVVARSQGSVASSIGRTSVNLLAGSSLMRAPLHRCMTHGADLATSLGTQMDAGGSTNVKGAWVEMVAATTHPTRMLAIALSSQISLNKTTGRGHLDLAIGAAGSEVIILGDLPIAANAGTDGFHRGLLGPYPVDLPAGVRIALRVSMAATSATPQRLVNATIHCLC